MTEGAFGPLPTAFFVSLPGRHVTFAAAVRSGIQDTDGGARFQNIQERIPEGSYYVCNPNCGASVVVVPDDLVGKCPDVFFKHVPRGS